MSDPAESTSSATSLRPVSRWGVGTLAVVQILSSLLLVIGANYLGAVHWQRLDLSRTADYTLSNITRQFVRSEEIQSRGDPVTLIAAFRHSSPLHARVRALAEEYAHLSNGKIRVELVDPVRDADRSQEIATAYGITFTTDMLIVDAAPAGEAKAKNAHVGAVAAEDMVHFTTDQKRQRKAVGFKGEDAITAALIRAVEGKPRVILFLADKSEIDASGDTSPWKVLSDALFARNIQLKPVNLADLQQIPDDTLAVTMVAPRYDLDERELGILEEYWGRPRSSILITLDPEHRPDRLRSFLRKHGVTPRNDRVVASRNGQTTSTVHATFTPGLDFTRDFWGKSTVFEGPTCSLEVRENAEDLAHRRISPFSLIEAADGFWGETRFTEPNPTLQPQEDHVRPLPIAAAVIRGTATDDRFADAASRLVVIANSSFLHPDRVRPEQMDFLTSCTNWLIGREALVGIGPTAYSIYKLPLLDAQVSFINRCNLFFLPGLALIAGLFAWNTRRQ